MKEWIVLLGLAGTAQAQELFTTIGGPTYALERIKDGVVLVNIIDQWDFIILTRDCQAAHHAWENGSWAWDRAGFRVILGEIVQRFPGPPPLDAPECGP